MTHSPPVPPGNQSPYPLQTAPHEPSSDTQNDVTTKHVEHQDEPIVSGTALGIGLAIGLGSAALLAAWFFSGEDKSKAKPAARKPRAKPTAPRSRAKSTGRASTAKSAPARRRKTTSEDQ